MVAAGAAALAMAAAAPASASITLYGASMDGTYWTHLVGIPTQPDVYAYSNGVTFNTSVGDLFGFCVDVYHDITVPGPHGFNPGYVYQSNQALGTNPLPQDFGGNVVHPDQLAKIINLVDSGAYLHEHEVGNDPDTEMRLAAIQSAIWAIEVPTITVTPYGGNIGSSGGWSGYQLSNETAHTYASQFDAYSSYYNDYLNGQYVSHADANDSFYVISDGVHQSFAIGWPIANVPEPATWGLMIMGFGGIGAAMRRRRAMGAFA
jgi:hypothetical protein